jgi:hypothetical protein
VQRAYRHWWCPYRNIKLLNRDSLAPLPVRTPHRGEVAGMEAELRGRGLKDLTEPRQELPKIHWIGV